MSDIDSAVVTPIETLLARLPAGTHPVGRMVWAGGLGGAVAYTVRPSVSFAADGSPRPWILTDSENPEAAVFPWWGFIALPAVIFGVFV